MTTHTGTVMQALRGFFAVLVEPDELVVCRAKGKFEVDGITPAVGDRVTIQRDSTDRLAGTVTAVMPRSSVLLRPPIVNADTVLVVCAATQPTFHPWMLDKLLVHVELARLTPVICLTKLDLISKGGSLYDEALSAQLTRVMENYTRIGYLVMSLDYTIPATVARLREHLTGRMAVVAGGSGVGKTTLLNALIPTLQLSTGGVSVRTGQGKHTTRHVTLYRHAHNGYLADTPGFSQLSFEKMDKKEIMLGFPEFRSQMGACKFRGCLHLNEPSCAVHQAVEQGTIDPHRYDHYVSFVHEVQPPKWRS